MPSLTVIAPGSVTPAREALLQAFARVAPDALVRFHPPAYSGLLAEEIRQGAPADLFISASMAYLQALRVEGLVPEPRPLARNRLCLVARAGLTPGELSIHDLGRDGVRLVIPPAGSDPLGEYAALLFARAGLATFIERKRQRGEVRHELASLRDWLVNSEVDAAVIYASMAPLFGKVAEIVPLPESLDMRDEAVFGVGVVRRDSAAHPAAEQFMAFLLAGEGQQVLIDAGFLPLHE